MSTRSLALIAVLAIGCGGSTPAVDAPKSDASATPPTSAATKPAGDATAAKPAGDAPKDAAKPADAKPADAKPADAKPADAKAAPKDERLEDRKTATATGTAGSYKTGVLSAAGLDPGEIGKALNASAGKLDGCYSSYLSKKPAPGLHTSFDVVVSATGKTDSAKMRADETKSPDLLKCLEGVLKGVAWPKPTEKVGKTTVEWTLGT